MKQPFLHWSATPLVEVRSIKQDNARNDKPNGLWFSVGDGEDGWRAWCQTEQVSFFYGTHCTELIFEHDAPILYLASPIDLDRFTGTYGIVERYGFRTIDWQAVADHHSAIVIAPYQWERRLSEATRWYYGWDCASGCVWDSSIIKDLRPFCY